MFACILTYVLAFTLCSSWLCLHCSKQWDPVMARLVAEAAADRHKNCLCRCLFFRVGRAAALAWTTFLVFRFSSGEAWMP